MSVEVAAAVLHKLAAEAVNVHVSQHVFLMSWRDTSLQLHNFVLYQSVYEMLLMLSVVRAMEIMHA